jgi:exodeoxyribonuclease V alpha subunit
MVDVAMFAAMLAALPAKARLILLGDKDQLASVEAGAILAELCRDAEQGGYSTDTADWLLKQSGQQIPPQFISDKPGALEQQLLMLRTSHRFGANSGIGKLAAAVNQGEADLAWQLLLEQRPDLALLQLHPANPAFKSLVLDGGSTTGGQGGFRHYLQLVQQVPAMDQAAGQSEQQHQLQHQQKNEQWAKAVLQAFGSFQLLCALRQGEFGVEQLNQRISQLLLQERLIQRADGWYPGRPVMISQNDYATGLMNGDVGICLARYELQQGQWQQRLRVVFPPARHGEPLRWLMPSRLPLLETVYAMTVHKSQGSEFAHAVLVLPDKSSVLLNRELIYTGITRAANCFTLLCPEASVFKAAVQSRTERSGGLRL